MNVKQNTSNTFFAQNLDSGKYRKTRLIKYTKGKKVNEFFRLFAIEFRSKTEQREKENKSNKDTKR